MSKIVSCILGLNHPMFATFTARNAAVHSAIVDLQATALIATAPSIDIEVCPETVRSAPSYRNNVFFHKLPRSIQSVYPF